MAVIMFLFGWLWHGPLFGNAWRRAMRVTSRDIEMAKRKGMAGTMVIGFITILITTFAFAIFVKSIGAVTIWAGALIGIFMWAGFYLMTSIGTVLWERKPMSLFYINTFYDLVRFVIAGAILAAW